MLAGKMGVEAVAPLRTLVLGLVKDTLFAVGL
jgi:hypothetical protein